MPPLHRSFSFQVSEAFNEVLKKTDTKTQKYEFNYEGPINNFKSLGHHGLLHKVLAKSFSCDSYSNKWNQLHNKALNRFSSLPKRLGEINYTVSISNHIQQIHVIYLCVFIGNIYMFNFCINSSLSAKLIYISLSLNF